MPGGGDLIRVVSEVHVPSLFHYFFSCCCCPQPWHPEISKLNNQAIITTITSSFRAIESYKSDQQFQPKRSKKSSTDQQKIHKKVLNWSAVWEPPCFSARYALGDYLEMASMGSLGGAAYQILLQSKLVITALMPRGRILFCEHHLAFQMFFFFFFRIFVYLIFMNFQMFFVIFSEQLMFFFLFLDHPGARPECRNHAGTKHPVHIAVQFWSTFSQSFSKICA